jgi:AcrR family transcriptional regulator
MGIADRRERERQELREKILAAARELFVDEGYEAMTMRRLAEKIEYSTTAIYVHFKDKDSLLAELMARDFGTFAVEMQRASRVRDPIERLRRLGETYIEFGLAHPNHYRLMFMTPRPESSDAALPHPTLPSDSAYAGLRVAVEEALAAGRLRRDLRDPDAVAQAMWSAMHGLVSLEIVLGGASSKIGWRPVKRTARILLDALLGGMAS